MQIQIFKPGTHTDNAGNTLSFSDNDLADCAAAYDPVRHEAPVVVGHPALDAPAYGWVKSLSYSDGLVAQVDQIDPEFSELIRAGRYKKVSASFYLPHSPGNPTPGLLSLRHIGFLGAQPPAIKGLKPVSFSAHEDGVVEFGEYSDAPEDPINQNPQLINPQGDSMSAEEKARLAVLEEENRLLKEQAAHAAEQLRLGKAAARHAEHLAFCEALNKDGVRVPPGKFQAIVATLDFIASQEGVVEFSEGDAKKPLVSGLKELFSSLPVQVVYGEHKPDQSASFADGDDADAIKARAQQKWQASADLRAEFGEFSAYEAYERAHANGQVKILRGDNG